MIDARDSTASTSESRPRQRPSGAILPRGESRATEQATCHPPQTRGLRHNDD